MATMYVYNVPTDETVRLRKTASSTGTILVNVKYGEAVEATKYNSTWHKATYKRYSGYMMSKYLTSTNPNSGSSGGGSTSGISVGDTVITILPGVNFRSTPGGTSLFQVSTGTTMEVTALTSSGGYTWYKGVISGSTGYLRGDCVSKHTGSSSGTGSEDTWDNVVAGRLSLKKASNTSTVSEAVKTLQRYLKNIGYGSNNCGNIVVDGNFGSITETAVKYFQTECELTSDGIVGPATATKLEQVQTNSYFTNSNYFPLNSTLFTYDNYPYNEVSLVARIICAEHGYVGSGHYEGRIGVAKVLKNRKDRGGVTLYDNNKIRDFKNIIFGKNKQYTTATSALAYRVKRGSSAFKEAVDYATMICGGNTPSGASLVTNQLFQKGYTADSATYQAKPGYCRYPATGSKYSFFYN